MLYKKLTNIYSQNNALENEYPLEEYYPLLNYFIAQEVSLGSKYLSPYRFSLVNPSISPKDSIRFFLGLTDGDAENTVLKQLYKYECEVCERDNILKSEEDLINFKCKHCGDEDTLNSSDFLSEVKLLFKLNEDIYYSMSANLKSNPLFMEEVKPQAVIKTGIDQSISVKSAEDVLYKNDRSIGEKPVQRMETLKKYQNYLIG